MKPLIVLGIMSGTSIDSVDYALCAIGRHHIELRDYWQTRYPASLQRRLHNAARGEAPGHEVAQLHHDLGRFYARHAYRPASPAPQLAGLHGQTVFHHPHSRHPATWQIGEPAYLVESLRIPVVSNFRVADLAAGGQGAPLATMFHRWIFARRGQHVCVNNLGGISNVTSLNWTSGPQPQILAFDTGPANVLLDIAMRHFTNGKSSVDRDGRWAARGQPNENILRCWLAHEFFARTPPKSTGRELFGESFFKQAEKQMRRAGLSRCDMLATLTEFTARSIALNYRLHLPAPAQKVILAGGGAANPILVQAIGCHLRELWPAVEVVPAQTMGWPLQSIEAAAFALLACLRWRRIPGNFPATTGARRPALLGQLSEP